MNKLKAGDVVIEVHGWYNHCTLTVLGYFPNSNKVHIRVECKERQFIHTASSLEEHLELCPVNNSPLSQVLK